MKSRQVPITDEQLLKELTQARRTSKTHLVGVVVVSIGAYILLEFLINLSVFAQDFPPILAVLGTSKVVGSGAPLARDWRLDGGIADTDAVTLVVTMLATVVTINVAAIAATLSTRETESAEHALNRWFARMETVARIAPTVALAIALTRFPGNGGLGVGLLGVGAIAAAASNLDLVGQLRTIRVKVRLAEAKEADQRAARAVEIFENMIHPWAAVRMSSRGVLAQRRMMYRFVWIILLLNVVVSQVLAYSFDKLEASSTPIPIFVILISIMDLIIIGFFLTVILAGTFFGLIWEARIRATRMPGDGRRPRPWMVLAFLIVTTASAAFLITIPTTDDEIIGRVFGLPLAATCLLMGPIVLVGWFLGRGPGTYPIVYALGTVRAAREVAAEWLTESRALVVAAEEEDRADVAIVDKGTGGDRPRWFQRFGKG